MSTLPFLLSVADELDNIHTQSYMDDFGLGFHPHRQYYRTPTIQLSLPASSDWTGRDWQGRHARYRSYKFYDDTQNNLEEVDEDTQRESKEQQRQQLQRLEDNNREQSQQQQHQHQPQQQQQQQQQQVHTAKMVMVKSNSHDVGVGGMGLNLKESEEEDENIDRTVRMYNLSKKCCKNYYRHALEMDGTGLASGRGKCSSLRGSGAGIGNGSGSHQTPTESSSEESLQKVPSPIEFLTCFLVKKSRGSSSKCSARAADQLRKS
ncbi:myb-like protein I [Drosophila innubila]|uniref:myb-like protein I n=1 Tax=Drosophila innubila TaxID=198719 RepID=UPI00148DE261|nr:myb-like protein I [Drosophila innubila]